MGGGGDGVGEGGKERWENFLYLPPMNYIQKKKHRTVKFKCKYYIQIIEIFNIHIFYSKNSKYINSNTF